MAISEGIFGADRYVVVKVGNLVIINMYSPCVGTADRMCIIEDYCMRLGRGMRNILNVLSS